MPVTLPYAIHGRNACGFVRLAIADVGPAGPELRSSEIRNGICNAITTAVTIATPLSFLVTASATSRGAATKIPERCDCSRNHASAAAIATCHIGDAAFNESAIAVAILIIAAATGGFQIHDDSAMSNAADAINSDIASASDQ